MNATLKDTKLFQLFFIQNHKKFLSCINKVMNELSFQTKKVFWYLCIQLYVFPDVLQKTAAGTIFSCCPSLNFLIHVSRSNHSCTSREVLFWFNASKGDSRGVDMLQKVSPNTTVFVLLSSPVLIFYSRVQKYEVTERKAFHNSVALQSSFTVLLLLLEHAIIYTNDSELKMRLSAEENLLSSKVYGFCRPAIWKWFITYFSF